MSILGKYYLLNSLPPLEANFQAQPPLSSATFWRRVQEEESSFQELIQAILLEKDISNLEQVAFHQKPLSVASISLESLARIWEEKGLAERFFPSALSEWIEPEKWHEEIWDAYFDYCFGMARRYDSSLQEWLTWNLGLKKAFYEKRDLEPVKRREFRAFIPNDDDREYQNIIQLYYKASHPMEAELSLDKVRWEKITTLANPYSFSQDEVVVYALHLLLLERWWTISQNQVNILQKVSNV